MTHPKVLFFGAIGTLVETSDMQRRAFNAAFAHVGLDWHWGRAEYRRMLQSPGGASRIAAYAEDRRQQVDVAAIHRAKVGYFREFAREGLEPRPGVVEVIERAQSIGVLLGFATTTGSKTVDLIFEGLEGHLSRDAFDFIGDRDFVSASKPSPEIYRLGLSHFGISAKDAVAIEDTPESAQSALSAGIETLAFPGEEARARSFPAGVSHNVDRLQPGFCGLGLAAA